MLEFKVSWYISDHSVAGHGMTLIVPGSHLWTVEQRATWQQWLKPEDVVQIRVVCILPCNMLSSICGWFSVGC
jgi:hypothetical protein